MFELAQPWILLLLLLPILIWGLIPKAKEVLPAALTVPFYDALSTYMQQEKRPLAAPAKGWVLFLVWVLGILAAAGPRWVGAPIPLERNGLNIMMALDLSGSMELHDMVLQGRPVSRLTVVKRAAEQFVKDRPSDKVGLILFGTRAYLQTPLTYDHQTVLTRLHESEVGLAGKTTSIGDALGLAVKRMQDIPAAGRVIILLTDGASNSGFLTPIKGAELAKDDHIKIYTIGLGAEASAAGFNSVFMGFGAGSDLDEPTLKKIADMTGGRYFRATDPQSLHAIYKTINQLEQTSQEDTTIRPQIEYYPWLLAGAILLFLYWFFVKAGGWQWVSSGHRQAEQAG